MCMKCRQLCNCKDEDTPKVDWTKPIQTRDGRPAEFIGLRKSQTGFTRIVTVESGGYDDFYAVQEDGHAFYMAPAVSDNDIINVPEKMVRPVVYLHLRQGMYNTPIANVSRKRVIMSQTEKIISCLCDETMPESEAKARGLDYVDA